MPKDFPQERIRIEVDVTAKSGSAGFIDQITRSTPDMWKATDVQFELAFFYGSTGDEDRELIDITNIATLTFEAKRSDNLLAPSEFRAVIPIGEMDPLLTQEQWDAHTSQHALIEFSNTETDIDMEGLAERKLKIFIHATMADGKKVVLGAAQLSIHETGVTGSNVGTTAKVGANLVGVGAVYDGSGEYELTVEEDVVHEYTKGANDTSLDNTPEILTGSGRFTSNGTTVTLTGTIGEAVTAVVRKALVYTIDEIQALLDSKIGLQLEAGQTITFKSPDGTKARALGVDNNNNPYWQQIPLT